MNETTTLEPSKAAYESHNRVPLTWDDSAPYIPKPETGLVGAIRSVCRALASHEETVRRLVILIALFAIPATVTIGAVIDPDIWWHLRTGQWIVEHGALPATDPFSFYGMGKPWIVYTWLFDVLIYGLYNRLGLIGILVYRVVLSVAVAAGLHRLVAKREPRFAATIGMVGFAMFAIVQLLSERPWLFTILFVTLTLDTVLDCRDGKRTRMYWLLPAIYAFWANIHIQFVYGLLILGLGCAAPLLDPLLRGGGLHGVRTVASSQNWRRIVALTGVCTAATLLNPYHVHLYSVVIIYATQHAPFQYIQELKAMDFRNPTDWAVLAISGAAAFAIGRRGKIAAFEALVFIASAYFAFRIKRDIWFVIMAALTLLTTGHPTEKMAERFVLTPLRTFSIAIGVLAVALIVAQARGISERSLEFALDKVYPVTAAAAVEQHGYAGPLYNDFNWGGYLIWRLRNLPVAMDGRTNVHGDDRIVRSMETWTGTNSWTSDPELTSAGLVISGQDWPLASLLRLDPRFQLVYEDAIAVVFVPRSKAGIFEPGTACAGCAASVTSRF